MKSKFRRQHIIDTYIVDFVCIKKKLVIEVDGKIHDYQTEYDAQRTQYLNLQGFRVVRFPNYDVVNNLNQVIAKITEILNQLA